MLGKAVVQKATPDTFYIALVRLQGSECSVLSSALEYIVI